jgi:hypothetical protein
MEQENQTAPAPATPSLDEKPESTIETRAAEIAPQNQTSPTLSPPELPEKKGEDLGDDLLVEFTLVVRSREGTILEIKNSPRLPMALHSVLMTEAIRQFETVMDNLLVRPAKIRFNDYIQKRKQADQISDNPKTIGTKSPSEAGSNPANPFVLVSPSIKYGSTIAECVERNARLESGK